MGASSSRSFVSLWGLSMTCVSFRPCPLLHCGPSPWLHVVPVCCKGYPVPLWASPGLQELLLCTWNTSYPTSVLTLLFLSLLSPSHCHAAVSFFHLLSQRHTQHCLWLNSGSNGSLLEPSVAAYDLTWVSCSALYLCNSPINRTLQCKPYRYGDFRNCRITEE